MMYYVSRNEGKIETIFGMPQDGLDLEEIPDDATEILAFFNPPLAIPDYQSAVQSHVDQMARSQQFNDGVTLASYKDSTNALWAAQAAAFIAWRDQVWAYSYEQLAAVQAAIRPQPSIQELIAELPAISWPE
jgi:hypothetical protein